MNLLDRCRPKYKYMAIRRSHVKSRIRAPSLSQCLEQFSLSFSLSSFLFMHVCRWASSFRLYCIQWLQSQHEGPQRSQMNSTVYTPLCSLFLWPRRSSQIIHARCARKRPVARFTSTLSIFTFSWRLFFLQPYRYYILPANGI